MFGYQLEGLKRLNVPVKKWGSAYRIKVRGRTGRLTYITNLDSQVNLNRIAKQYKIDINKLKNNLSPDFKDESKYRFTRGEKYETHAYSNIPSSEFYNKLENVMSTQAKSYKINIQLAYRLINRSTGEESDWYPTSKTGVYDLPIAINSRSDIRRVIDDIKVKRFEDRLNYPSSAFKLKAITGFKIIIYYRNHELGSSEAIIPEAIRSNRHVVNMPSTANKCVFYCLAYHFKSQEEAALKQNLSERANKAIVDPRRLQSAVKELFKRWCAYKGIKYSLSLYRNFNPIDILEFDQIEDCFQCNIDVYALNEETSEYNRIRKTDKDYPQNISILSHVGHALYISCADRFLGKYQCPKCQMVFTDKDKLRNHKKNKCEQTEIERFVKYPTIYKPVKNTIKSLLEEFAINDVDHYTDHFIVYDFESILKPTGEQHGDKTVFTNKHIPVSVSVCDSLSKQVRCFINESPKALLTEMFDYIHEKQSLIEEYNRTKFSRLLEKIDDPPHPITQIPLIGFNSGKYDINIIKADLFNVLCDVNHSIKSGNGYMVISTPRLKILDISNYVPAGTSYDNYLTTYLGGCKCLDKITCECGLGKGIFPYEHIDSFNVLNQTELPPREAFNSSLRGTKLSEFDYERAKYVWKRYNMKTIKDLLVWYNNLDVVPFIDAIKAQRELFKRFGLDMFADGISLPGLSEKVMYKTCFDNLLQPSKEPAKAFEFPTRRFSGYRLQDKNAGREFGMTLKHLNELLQKQDYLCYLCYTKLNADTASADRIDNSLGHIDGNINISCYKCNCGRKDSSIPKYQESKLFQFNRDRLIHSIDEEHSDIYHKMRANIAGGPSIIFNRYAKRNETTIRGNKLCKKVIGYDANALYLWAIGDEMPCGRLTTIEAHDGIIQDIVDDKLFGFLECDIETPEHLKGHFAEMCPIFKNTEIDPSDRSVIGDHMFEYNLKKESGRAIKSRKLIGSYFGSKILIYTPLLKWYLSHGLVITKTHCFIKASSHKPFKPFMEAVSDARREGDSDKSKSMIAEMMKLVGNTPFGRSGMDMSKHRDTKYASDPEKVDKLIEHFTFEGLEELNDSWEVSMKKRIVRLKNPIHVSIAIYQLAKLRMLEFYYDCMDRYIDRSDFQYLEMDTDSAYIAFSDENPFENLIKPELRAEFEEKKHDWFPRTDTKEHRAFDKRKPGLFKEEWRGDEMISLSSKNYCCSLPDSKHKVKISAKGVQQGRGRNHDVLNPAAFKSVVMNRITMSGENRGFRVCKESKTIITYMTTKTALNYYYDKRRVLEDGISTEPLDL